MAKFVEFGAGSREAFFVNLENIEQIDPSCNMFYTTSGESYTVGDSDMEWLVSWVRNNLVSSRIAEHP